MEAKSCPLIFPQCNHISKNENPPYVVSIINPIPNCDIPNIYTSPPNAYIVITPIFHLQKRFWYHRYSIPFTPTSVLLISIPPPQIWYRLYLFLNPKYAVVNISTPLQNAVLRMSINHPPMGYWFFPPPGVAAMDHKKEPNIIKANQFS